MQKYLCIHGHFYQPPRENPWLEAIEIQDSAYPYHDWNERIAAECYAPNSASRNLDSEGRILDIKSNYKRISFNFGPTLLAWMERYDPETYKAILEADRQSAEWRSGHGNAIAQVYSHIIMPLANTRDKRTQVIWGIKDFKYRFKRLPEGMWLSETAVDTETLEILAEHGIKFTILAPRQAHKVRKIGAGKWKDISDSRIDPTRAYLCSLPSRRTICLFFYDGPISQAVAFEHLLKRGEDFADRLLSGFSNTREWPQLLNIAADGETYGHHQKFGDMTLAFTLNSLEFRGLARITNYAEYLSLHPPTHEVKIFENSSWSCFHGVERWRGDCGCNSGGHQGWDQAWRKPLRENIDWLRDRLSFAFEKVAGQYLKNPWQARNEYIAVILDRSQEAGENFLREHATIPLSGDEKIIVLKLLEMQRHAMLMYTSCGWFFDDLSGLETVQILQYAGRAMQLYEDIFKESIEDIFKKRLAQAKSNIPEHENGLVIYDKFVKSAMIDLKKVGAHYAVSSLFEDYIDETGIYSYAVTKEDFIKILAGDTKIAIGRVLVSSRITWESERVSFCVLHFGGHALNGGVRTFLGQDAYKAMKDEITMTFERGEFADIVRLMDNHFGMHNYSLPNLFRDQQRTILNLLIAQTMQDFEIAYRQMYEKNRILMGFLKEIGIPVQKAFLSAVEFTLNAALKKEFTEEVHAADKIQNIFNEIKRWGVPIDALEIEFAVRKALERLAELFSQNPADMDLPLEIQKRLELLRLLPIEINFWQIQNTYFNMAKTAYREMLARTSAGDEEAKKWIATFTYIGEMIFFNTAAILPAE